MSRAEQAAVFALWLAAALHAQAPATSLSLTVIDSVTQFPIVGAGVNLNNVKTSNIDNLLPTTAAGQVVFSGLAPGSYSLSVSAEGYSFNDFPYRGAITLEADEHRTLGLVPLDPLASLSGTVLDNDGKPVTRGRVEAMLVDVPPTGQSIFGAGIDEAGSFKITGLRRGKYVVGVASNTGLGIPASYYPNGGNFDQAIRVDIHAGLETEHIDFRVRRMQVYHVRGVVTGVSGADEAYISVRSCETRDVRDGFLNFSSSSVRPDRSFDIEVFPGDHCLDLQTFAPSEERRLHARTRVRVTNRDVDDIRILAAPPKELTGMVKIEKGSDLEMSGFLYLSGISTATPSAHPQPDGSFRLKGVFPTDYRLTVYVPGGYVKSAKLGGVELGDGYLNMESLGGPLWVEIASARGRAK